MTRSADEVAKSTDNDTEASESSTVSRDSSCLNEVADPAEPWQPYVEIVQGSSIESLLVPPGTEPPVDASDFLEGPKGSQGQLRSDLVAEAEKPPLPWELTRLGARAAWRAKQMAENSDALQGLRSMGEVAQDYPSGWARALSAGDANAAHARELMAFAEDIKVSDSLQVNGWKVPLKQRGHAVLNLAIAASFFATFSGSGTAGEFGTFTELGLGIVEECASWSEATVQGDPRLGHEAVAFDLGGKVVGAGLLMNLCNLKHLKFIQKVLKNRPPAVLWSALKELIKSKAGSEAAKKMLKRFASKRTDKDLCNDAVDRIQQAFRELWPNKDAPKLPSGSGSRLPFPVPSASINGRIVSGLDLLERTNAAFHDLWSLTGEQPKRYLHLAVPQCSNTATVPSVLHACLGQAINKTTALKGLAEALASLMDVTSEKLEATCSEALGESINVDVESCKAVKPILKDTGPGAGGRFLDLRTDTALWVNGRLYGPLELDPWLTIRSGQADADEALQKLKDANVSDYAIAYVLAVRARAVAEGFAARSGEAEDEAEQTQDARKTESAYYSADPSLQLHVAPKGEIAPLRIFSVMDPLGQAAQRLPALLQLLHEELDAEIFLALRPQRLAESPLTGYFRTAPVPKMSSPGL
eukprot:s253_g6.t1